FNPLIDFAARGPISLENFIREAGDSNVRKGVAGAGALTAVALLAKYKKFGAAGKGLVGLGALNAELTGADTPGSKPTNPLYVVVVASMGNPFGKGGQIPVAG